MKKKLTVALCFCLLALFLAGCCLPPSHYRGGHSSGHGHGKQGSSHGHKSGDPGRR